MRTLFCRYCGAGEPVVDGSVPRICPHCSHEAGWTTLAPPGALEPPSTLKFTRDDRAFLKAFRISAD